MRYFYFLFCFFLLQNSLIAHPQLLIKPSVQMVVKKNAVQGVQMIWVWDKWWTQDVLERCDTNKDGHLDEKEIQMVYKHFFSEIKSFHYFTVISFNNRKLKISQVSNFHAYLNPDKTISYSFFFPLPFEFQNEIKVSVAFNDETVYTAFGSTIKLLPVKGYQISDVKVGDYSYYGRKITFLLRQE